MVKHPMHKDSTPKEDIAYLRKVSRQRYLKQREKKKIDDLRDEIADDQFLFDGVNLTSTELAQFAHKKEVYDLIKDKDKEEDQIRYRIPEAYDDLQGNGVNQFKRFSAALEEHSYDNNRFSERDAWEEHQVAKSTLTFGSRNRNPEPHYEFLFGDQRINRRNPRTNPNSLLEPDLERERKSLPIAPYRNDFLQAVIDHQVLIIVGETGCGKTTQVPQYLHEAGYARSGTIACTQPRRVAAMSVAARVSQEMRVKLGHEVGYSIRFEDCTSEKTVIKYMTDGKMLREFLQDPVLSNYSVIMIDEAHERTVSTDILFGLIKDVARFRPELKILISSATLDADKFSDFFDSAPIFKIPGRKFPVEIQYTTCPQSDYLEAAVSTVLQIHVLEEPGDVVVFLTGQDEIESAEETLKQRISKLGSNKIGELIICPIYSNLPTELQAKIFDPTPEGARKVVLATNIAETSLTIDGISYVIDTGFSKMKSYSPRSRMESLLVSPISKASARQRAGRAGRTAPGKCFRLYTKSIYEQDMEDNTAPEIQRTNLANVVLTLKSLGIRDLQSFDFMDPPPSESLLTALELLYALSALNKLGEMTKVGRKMAEFPVDPMLSKAIVVSERYGCSEEMITIAAMLSVGNAVFYRPKERRYLADASRMRFHDGDVGDHIALMRVYNEWRSCEYSSSWCYENYVQARSMRRARDVREQLQGLLDQVEIERSSKVEDLEAIKKCITAGFFPHCARLQNEGAYRTVKNPHTTVEVHPSSGLAQTQPQPKWVVYHELVKTSKDYMRQVTEIKPQWLVEIAPHYYRLEEVQDAKKMPRGTGRSAL